MESEHKEPHLGAAVPHVRDSRRERDSGSEHGAAPDGYTVPAVRRVSSKKHEHRTEGYRAIRQRLAEVCERIGVPVPALSWAMHDSSNPGNWKHALQLSLGGCDEQLYLTDAELLPHAVFIGSDADVRLRNALLQLLTRSKRMTEAPGE
ncbi:hypothetical protein E4K72_01315 [Oxalobacteraceae bacterium OM1]|nr:hypothetical protein E4K72_01315 [Oxalobacteraceae bacterium OM1]